MHKGFLLLLWSSAHLCAIPALYAVPPKKERLPAVFLCFDQWSVKILFLFLCSFEDALYPYKIQFHENMSFLYFSGIQMKRFHLCIRAFRAQSSLLRVFLSACRAQKIPAENAPFSAGKHRFFGFQANIATTYVSPPYSMNTAPIRVQPAA